MQPTTITLSPAKAAIIYFQNSAPPLPTTIIKMSCKEQIKMKFNIALRQNCDQSATVWWSKRSSARHWTVREWHLTGNKSADSNREPIEMVREILLEWLVLLARKPPFFVTGPKG